VVMLHRACQIGHADGIETLHLGLLSRPNENGRRGRSTCAHGREVGREQKDAPGETLGVRWGLMLVRDDPGGIVDRAALRAQ
jgi:hypothetical protein